MKISNYEIEQRAQSTYMKSETKSVAIEVFEARPPSNGVNGEFIKLSLSEEALTGKIEDTVDLFHLSEEDQAKIRLLEKLIEALTGKEFKFNQVVKLKGNEGKNPEPKRAAPSMVMPNNNGNGNSSRAFGISIRTASELSESESMQFSSKGVIQTSDGRTIDFKLNFEMSRSYYEKSEMHIQIGERLQDPIVLNFDGKGIAFGEDSIEMDINLDGEVDYFRMLASGSGFLALDKNNNGTVDDGSELFGPKTGSGFGELAEYDEDQNNWIDETDEIFRELKIWSVNPQGVKTLVGLKDAGVGAIFIGHVSSQYQIKEGSELLAKIRETGTYLRENGLAGTIHEIDLKI